MGLMQRLAVPVYLEHVKVSAQEARSVRRHVNSYLTLHFTGYQYCPSFVQVRSRESSTAI